MSGSRWDNDRRRLEQLAHRRGVAWVARQIPASRESVYRIIQGRTKQSTLAVRRNVQRLLEREGLTNGNDNQRDGNPE